MRCHEARNRISVGDLDDTSLTEHLRSCPACARLAAAERRLSDSLRMVSKSGRNRRQRCRFYGNALNNWRPHLYERKYFLCHPCLTRFAFIAV